jgi:hypothetical protein
MRYQVWNEANLPLFWAGTPARMAELTRIAFTTIKAIDPGALVVSPSFLTRTEANYHELDVFLAQWAGGSPVRDFIDAVGVHLHPLDRDAPESVLGYLRADRLVLARHGVDRPIWNTEISYGAVDWNSPSVPLSSEMQAAYVARTYLLNAAAGVQRVFWYRWDLQSVVSTVLTESDRTTPTTAGQAFKIVRGWMVNSRLHGCTVNRVGTYRCTFTRDNRVTRVFWNATTPTARHLPRSAWWKMRLDGVKRRVHGGARLPIGPSPVAVRSAR